MKIHEYKAKQLKKLEEDYNLDKINLKDYNQKKKEIESLKKIPLGKSLDEKTEKELLIEILKELKSQSQKISANRENTKMLVNWLIAIPIVLVALYYLLVYSLNN